MWTAQQGRGRFCRGKELQRTPSACRAEQNDKDENFIVVEFRTRRRAVVRRAIFPVCLGSGGPDAHTSVASSEGLRHRAVFHLPIGSVSGDGCCGHVLTPLSRTTTCVLPLLTNRSADFTQLNLKELPVLFVFCGSPASGCVQRWLPRPACQRRTTCSGMAPSRATPPSGRCGSGAVLFLCHAACFGVGHESEGGALSRSKRLA